MMIIITATGVVALFVLLWLIVSARDRKPNETLVFNIPQEIIANHRPSMPLEEREKRRRRLLNEVFALGVNVRREFERKQIEDQSLGQQTYHIKKS